jgi:hypothetical protein
MKNEKSNRARAAGGYKRKLPVALSTQLWILVGDGSDDDAVSAVAASFTSRSEWVLAGVREIVDFWASLSSLWSYQMQKPRPVALDYAQSGLVEETMSCPSRVCNSKDKPD